MNAPLLYYPAHPGTRREYTTASSRPARGRLPAADLVERVAAVRATDSGHEVDLETQWSHGPWTRHTLRFTREGQLPHLAMESSSGPVRTHASSGVYLPATFEPGQHWDYVLEYETTLQRARLAGRGTVLGTERVEVPAGAFDAVHVLRATRHRVEVRAVDGQPAAPPLDAEQSDDEYWVRGVGLVLAHTRNATDYGAARALVRFVRGH